MVNDGTELESVDAPFRTSLFPSATDPALQRGRGVLASGRAAKAHGDIRDAGHVVDGSCFHADRDEVLQRARDGLRRERSAVEELRDGALRVEALIEYLAPGNWYKQNAHAPDNAIAAPSRYERDDDFFFLGRTTRKTHH